MANVVTFTVKGKVQRQADIDEILETYPANSIIMLLTLGLEQFSRRGMSKLTFKDLDEEELVEMHEKIAAKADENLAELKSGEFRVGAKKGGTKIAGAVKTRASQKAKAIVKDMLRKAGAKVSAVKAKDITAAAEKVLAAHPELIEEAREELEAQSTKAKGIEIDVSHLVTEETKAKPRKVSQKTLDALAAGRAKKKGEQRVARS